MIPQIQTIAVNPTQVTSSLDTTVTAIRINGYGQFDPNAGVTAQVALFNSQNQLIKPTQVRITGDDWQNWPTNQTADQDNAYVTGVILRQLGLTATT
jgi:hypothetical protein